MSKTKAYNNEISTQRTSTRVSQPFVQTNAPTPRELKSRTHKNPAMRKLHRPLRLGLQP
jgi:hypothetical protein